MEWSTLSMISDKERRELLAVARRRKFRRNEVLFHEGDPANSLHLIESGHVSVRVTTGAGDSVTLAVLGPGETVGELALLEADPSKAVRSATVTALEGCETLSLQRDRFDALRQQYPRVDRVLAELLANEVRRLNGRLLEFLYLPADKRVLRRLATLARAYDDGRTRPVAVPLTQEVIASLAGTSRPTTNQALRAVEEAGIIAIGRSKIEILNPAALVRKAR
ncbi:Crp/Fnr family transcriptional regulator [Cryptosporangium aurantiacum]|uniref:cAMP-binding domain of CRP or a regulatory subunit of cAMP-dependent protein kinases n=1 Tax=Cryptosporangium aurantiacum TaxID=134849 RepID=A0A1M7QXM2_9ACTN|nr:Crp/Fnr family transcriptional regulator [Cryptosporangium aurantiacum]SHN36827.1 cAMP-binding domain of CRP or a regulatory subunit of cAMP-dependent protein kinases [Cryptosporangium aurantiacum]